MGDAKSPTLRGWAGRERFRVRTDPDGDAVVRGKRGHVYEYGPGRLAATFMPGPPDDRKAIFKLGRVRRRLVAAGGKVIQNGDTEGTFLYTVPTPEQTALIARLLSIRRLMTTYGVSKPMPARSPRKRPSNKGVA